MHHFGGGDARDWGVQQPCRHVEWGRGYCGRVGSRYYGVMCVRGHEGRVEEDELAGVGVDSRMGGGPFLHKAEDAGSTKAGTVFASFLTLCALAVKPANGLKSGKGNAHGWSTLTGRQRSPIVEQDAGVGDADFFDGLCGARKAGEDDKQDSAENTEDDVEEGGERTNQCCDAGENGCSNEGGRQARQVQISEDELVDKFRLDPLLSPPKSDPSQHAIAVKPVSISAQIFICYRVAAISNILAAMQLLWNHSGIGARSEWPGVTDRGEIAREIWMPCLPLPLLELDGSHRCGGRMSEETICEFQRPKVLTGAGRKEEGGRWSLEFHRLVHGLEGRGELVVLVQTQRRGKGWSLVRLLFWHERSGLVWVCEW